MGRKSSVDRLPQHLRARLLELLQNPAVTQEEIADAINSEAGEPLISRKVVNRYAQRMKRFAEKNRQAQQIADAYVEKYGTENRVKLGKVVNEQMRLAVFDLIDQVEEMQADPESTVKDIAGVLSSLARSIRDLETAEKLNAERTEAIRKAALAEAAETVETTAKASGLSAQAVDTIKQKILGL
jgi:hypothetical protein